jgi:alanyl-tRNA synthetase
LNVDHSVAANIRNHSATHLLHEALRQVLGDHVAQKGSLVAPERLRFDFSHPKPMTAQEIEKVEDIANDYVTQNSAVTTRLMASKTPLPGRVRCSAKYGDEVRVVAMGDKPGSNTLGWSVELCGGTHVRRTGDIGLISVVSDSGVAAGVRRLEALTGRAARKAANATMQAAQSVAGDLLRVSVPTCRASPNCSTSARSSSATSDAKKLAMGGGVDRR